MGRKAVKKPPKRKKVQEKKAAEETRRQHKSDVTNDTSEVLETVHLCDICGSGFKTQPCLKRHQLIHSDIKPHACSQCKKAFRTVSRLKGHMRSHTKEKPVKCETCGVGLASSGALLMHKRLHTGERPNICHTCQKPFTTKGQLQRHERTHTGDRPYQCSVCSSTFSDTGALKTHMRLHTGEKPFSCDVCGKRFTVKCALKSHYRLHSGERPYICDVCGNAYAASSQLTAHKMRAHFRKKAYSCHVCGVGYTKMKYIKAHMARIHPEHEASSLSGLKNGRQWAFLTDKGDTNRNFLDFVKAQMVQYHAEHETESLMTSKMNRQRQYLLGESGSILQKDDKLNVMFVPKGENLTDRHMASSSSEDVAVKILPASQRAVDQSNFAAPSTYLSGGSNGADVTSALPSTQLSGKQTGDTLSSLGKGSTSLCPSEKVIPPVNFTEALPSSQPFSLLTPEGPCGPCPTANSRSQRVNPTAPSAQLSRDCSGAEWVKAVSGISNRVNFDNRQEEYVTKSPVYNADLVFKSHPDSAKGLQLHERESGKDENIHFMSMAPSTQLSGVCNENKWNSKLQFGQSDMHTFKHISKSSLENGSQCCQTVSDAIERERRNCSIVVSDHTKNTENTLNVPSSVKMGEKTRRNKNDNAKCSSVSNSEDIRTDRHGLLQKTKNCDTKQSDAAIDAEDSDLNDHSRVHEFSADSNHSKQSNFTAQDDQDDVMHDDNSVDDVSAGDRQNNDKPKEEGGFGNHVSERDESHQNVFCSVVAQAGLQAGQRGPRLSQRHFMHKSNNMAKIDVSADEAHLSSYFATKPEQLKLDPKSLPRKSFLCETCAASFSSKSYLKAHMRSHTGEKPFACQHCPAAFTRSVQLKHHVRSHTGESAYICDTCGARLSSSGALACHKRLHSGDKPFVCSKCQKRFTTRGQQQRHERIHTGQRPYACKLCKAAFADTSALKTHMRVHTGEKPYVCEVCEKRFTVKSALTSHARLHTGERPHVCGVCGEGYPTACGLAAHRNRAHIGKKAFSCPVCGIGYTKTKYVKAHLERCHPEHG